MAKVYILMKGSEKVEVLAGRNERRDALIARGYVWVNKPKPVRKKAAASRPVRVAGAASSEGDNGRS